LTVASVEQSGGIRLGVSNVDRRDTTSVEVLKVSSKSSPNAVAGALAGVIRERGYAEIQGIGAGAINQAIKAVAIARGFVAPSGVDLVCVPAFTDITIDGQERTAIKLIVTSRN
jgi:stage V sporulation protein S